MPEIIQSSLSTALHSSLSEGQITGFQDVALGQAHMPGSSDFPTPTKTSQRTILASQELDGCQTLDAYVRHRSESLPPIRTLSQDEGSTVYISQTRSASEGVRMLRKRKNNTDVTAGDENQKYYHPLIATIPISARNLRFGLDTVIKVDLGSSFRDVVTLLIDIETLYGFTSSVKGLPRQFRPSEISSWIAKGRGRAGGRVIVVNIEEFSKTWWKWWTHMQPKWRERDAHDKPKQMIPVRAEDEDWTCLHKPGANGMISVVAGLHGWGVAIKKQIVPLGSGGEKADWLHAVEDCRWAMKRLLEYSKEGHRSEEDELDIETVYDDIDHMQGDSS